MSKQSYLEKLLDGEEVEWKTLGDVIKSLKTGLNPRKNFTLNTPDAKGYYVTVREIQNGKIVFLDKTDRVNDEALKLINNRSILEVGDILFSGTGTVGRIAVIKYPPQNWNIKEGVYVIKPSREVINSKYIAHLLNSQKIVQEYSRKIVGSPVISIPMSALKKLKIPIPCPSNPKKSLAIQSEIVRILDAFTSLTAELTAELNMRKKQYNYYRNKLLTFEDGEVEQKTLGNTDYFDIGSGGTPSKSKLEYWSGGSVPWIKSESCNNNLIYEATNFITDLGLQKSSARLLDKQTTLIALVGATIFKTAFLEFQAATNQNIASIKSKKPNVINDKFIFYYVTNLYEKLKQEMRNYGMLNLTTLKQFTISVPPLAEQSRIVSILDKFDALTNSISEGLPREINLRQKQYEYYRDQLLSFRRPAEVNA